MSGRHVLVVGPFDPDDATDRFDVEHPDDCPESPRYAGPDGGDINGYDCAVGVYVDDAGIDYYFAHADDPARVPVWLAGRGFTYLTADGGTTTERNAA